MTCFVIVSVNFCADEVHCSEGIQGTTLKVCVVDKHAWVAYLHPIVSVLGSLVGLGIWLNFNFQFLRKLLNASELPFHHMKNRD